MAGALVLSICSDTKGEYPISIASNDILTQDTLIKRVQDVDGYAIKRPMGMWRKLYTFTMFPGQHRTAQNASTILKAAMKDVIKDSYAAVYGETTAKRAKREQPKKHRAAETSDINKLLKPLPLANTNVPPELKCKYKTCNNGRSLKKNGDHHMLCNYHRNKVNSIQRTYAAKRDQEKREQRKTEHKDKDVAVAPSTNTSSKMTFSKSSTAAKMAAKKLDALPEEFFVSELPTTPAKTKKSKFVLFTMDDLIASGPSSSCIRSPQNSNPRPMRQQPRPPMKKPEHKPALVNIDDFPPGKTSNKRISDDCNARPAKTKVGPPKCVLEPLSSDDASGGMIKFLEMPENTKKGDYIAKVLTTKTKWLQVT
ncbi:hypothetical protein, variant 1 [Saprolegnia diclina VS20]|uniref:Uncharacterized protein n=1 Tax=Saprolegnia diclina (strain VS20) TaxID=1156394 RepID=T0RAD7_SAPDV|nr:hypothetical protein, variant 1 [Saprolegnia diclina VS20]EQC26467.1 hypothetical protein, variant 1 [Saprolegnia diclina VS20]|eukprot:XP_008620113.1 hypothetical protein, variant 1 [Saprolegnia diclina VS20]